ncbi:PREDICTED: uncharacterized protein LOC105450424 [Wasmannia auropunctata]|uniref:uncharacterized protein LOC105450424 n=1 Tax=Wasmannia auropunctata TaxID=64793 RepID=UPI0005EDC153|nr:PREDICTED: uncharacterized protein LOC105450424 [Wasmannia auropunctata]
MVQEHPEVLRDEWIRAEILLCGHSGVVCNSRDRVCQQRRVSIFGCDRSDALFNYLVGEAAPSLCAWKTAKGSKRNKLARSFGRFEAAVFSSVFIRGPGSDK